MSLFRQWAKRLLANRTVGTLVAKTTMHQIDTYERRLPRLWSLYARIPQGAVEASAGFSNQGRLLKSYYSFLSDHVPTLDYQPTISVVMPVYRTNPEFLRQALQSVELQVYENWELCVVDDCSQDSNVTHLLEAFAGRNPDRVKLKVLETNQGIAAASNAALAMATGEYVALLDHDDRLCPNALAEVFSHANLNVQLNEMVPEILFSDERVISEHGHPLHDPFMKPDWSPLMHQSVNYTTHLSVYSRGLLERVGGFRSGFDGSQDHDLMLRAVEATDTDVVHIPAVLYQWRAHEQSTAQSLSAKPAAVSAGIAAVKDSCERRGFPAEVTFEPSTGHYRLDFTISEPKPLVSVVIPTFNAVDMLQRCVESIQRMTRYPNYELVLVDNGSDDADALGYLKGLAESGAAKVVRDAGYFNFSRLCNLGVANASGQFVVLLNNDTEVLTPDWLEAMVGLAQLPRCGAVGAKLLYPSGKVQHAGIVGLADVIAGHSGRGRPADDSMYIHVINTVHEAIAVTGACMCIRKETFEQVGGFDERWVPNAYSDVDLGLRLRESGFFNVYTPYAVLTHWESPSRSRNIEDFERYYMRKRWGNVLLTDPYLNPNLMRSEFYDLDYRFDHADMPNSFLDLLLPSSGTVGNRP